MALENKNTNEENEKQKVEWEKKQLFGNLSRLTGSNEITGEGIAKKIDKDANSQESESSKSDKKDSKNIFTESANSMIQKTHTMIADDIAKNGGENSAKYTEKLKNIESELTARLEKIPKNASNEEKEKAYSEAMDAFNNSLGELRGSINGPLGNQKETEQEKNKRIQKEQEKAQKEFMDTLKESIVNEKLKRLEEKVLKNREMANNHSKAEKPEKENAPEKLTESLNLV